MPTRPRYVEYERIYRSVPIATRIVDTMVNSVYRDYRITANADQNSAITDFFVRTDFDSQFRQIVKDTVLYGDSFWRITGFTPFTWARIDPPQATLRIEPTNRGGGQAFRYTLEGITVGGTEVLPEALIHFKHRAGSGGSLGFSIYGEWFNVFDTIRDAEMAISRGATADAIYVHEYFEDKALIGADRMPDVVASRNHPEYVLPLTVNRDSPFAMFVQERQRELQDQIERELFPLVLNARWTPSGWPKFIIRGNLRIS